MCTVIQVPFSRLQQQGTAAELADVAALTAALGARTPTIPIPMTLLLLLTLTLTPILTLIPTPTLTPTLTLPGARFCFDSISAQPPPRTRATDAARAAAAPRWVWGAGSLDPLQ